jgi:4-amino-4-deoxy-L-arabinose transferase-like glycosyltransferase
MTHRNHKSLFFIGAFFLALALYWPSINGTPIWDDQSFWFNDPVMSPDFSYLTIWKNFAWPFSVSFQKFTLSLFGKKYFAYHLINIILHFLNALLVYKLGRLLRIKYPKFLFTLFLLHPSAVITTAWMVQVKTLLCFFFGLLALLCYFKIKRQNKFALASYLCFGLSILSKSASLSFSVS